VSARPVLRAVPVAPAKSKRPRRTRCHCREPHAFAVESIAVITPRGRREIDPLAWATYFPLDKSQSL
jgi:hypothetical protein